MRFVLGASRHSSFCTEASNPVKIAICDFGREAGLAACAGTADREREDVRVTSIPDAPVDTFAVMPR